MAPQQLAKGATLDTFVADLEAFYKDDFGVPTSQTATSLGGQPATRLVYQFTNDQGQDVTFVDDISVRGRTGWEVFLVTAGGESRHPGLRPVRRHIPVRRLRLGPPAGANGHGWSPGC